MAEKKTDVYPYREPKKFTKKDLHGRTRIILANYSDFKRMQKFYVNVFGWDFFAIPEAAGGTPIGAEAPTVVAATGPSYGTWEGFIPGHMNMMLSHAEKVERPMIWTEVHMDRPLKETVDDYVAHGGKCLTDLPDSDEEGWTSQAVVEDPAGNRMTLWKCPPSRTWEEPEAGYDKEE